MTTPDPNTSIRVGGISIAYGDDGAALVDQSDIAQVSAFTSSDLSLTTSVSTNLSADGSATTSLTSRLSTVDSGNLSATVSADTSLFSRLSTLSSTNTSSITSLTLRVSIAESVEASTH